VLELLNPGDARQAVPDSDQPVHRPTGGQLCQFIPAGEGIKRGGGGGPFLRSTMRRDVVCQYLG